jgi:hypothetical protein
MTTLLISGSRSATAPMLAYARASVLRAYENGWRLIVGDAVGIDAAVAQAAVDFYNQHAEKPEDDLNIYCTVYGLDEKPRHGIAGRGVNYSRLTYIEHRQISGSGSRQFVRIYQEAVTTYSARDRYMVSQADKVLCIWNGHSTGTLAVSKYAVKLGKEVWLKKDE